MKQNEQQQDSISTDTLNNTEETHKDDYLTEHKTIEGTPFMMRRVQNKWFITIGDTRITEPTDTEKEQLDKFVTEMWQIILKVCIHVNQRMDEYKKTHVHDNMTQLETGL